MSQLFKRVNIFIIILCCLFNVTFGDSHQRRLLKHLFIDQQYDKVERPTNNHTDPVSVSIRLDLQQIIDFDEEKNILLTSALLFETWNDDGMRWNPIDYGNISKIAVPSEKVWTPDIILYNSINEKVDSPIKVNVVLYHIGEVLYVQPKIFKSSCLKENKSEPSTYICDFKLGSWVLDSTDLNLTLSSDDVDKNSYVKNIKWDLKDTSAKLHTVAYACCPERFQHVMFTLRIGPYPQEFTESSAIGDTENKDALENEDE